MEPDEIALVGTIILFVLCLYFGVKLSVWIERKRWEYGIDRNLDRFKKERGL